MYIAGSCGKPANSLFCGLTSHFWNSEKKRLEPPKKVILKLPIVRWKSAIFCTFFLWITFPQMKSWKSLDLTWFSFWKRWPGMLAHIISWCGMNIFNGIILSHFTMEIQPSFGKNVGSLCFSLGESIIQHSQRMVGQRTRGLQQCLGRLFGKIVDRKNLLWQHYNR